jgi:hypothetical protein
MSYRDPKIYAADPTAFSKGFMQSFQTSIEAIAKRKEEKDRIAKEAEAAEAALISATDLGGYQDLDKKIYDAFQNNIRGIVDAGTFANMTPAEKQKTLFELRDFKQGFSKFSGILSLPASRIDKRNSDILELKTAIASSPDSIQVTGSGLDMSINFTSKSGESKSVSIKKLNSTKVIDITEFEEAHKKFDGDMFDNANTILLAGAKSGKYGQAEQLVLNDYATQLQDEFDEEDYAYVYTNKIGGDYGGSPEELQEKKKAVIDYKLNEYKQVVDSRKEYSEIFAPKPEIEKQTPAKDPRSFAQQLKDANASNRLNALRNIDIKSPVGPVEESGKKPKDFASTLFKPSEKSGMSNTTQFYNDLKVKMSNLGFDVALEGEIMKQVNGDPIYYPSTIVIKDNFSRQSRTLPLQNLTPDILNNTLDNLIKVDTSFLMSPQQGQGGLPVFNQN